MYYYLYKIQNKIDNKIYIGVHETENLNDEYFGSGKLIQRAIKKYGKQNFEKTILEFFETREQMYEAEYKVVNEFFILREDTYNLGIGGTGGSINQNRKPFAGPHSDETKNKISKSKLGKLCSEETKRKMSDNNWAKREPETQRLHAIEAGKKRWAKENESKSHSDDTKRKISESLKLHYKNKKKSDTKHFNLGKTRIKVKCPHCQKEGAMNTMSRFHFDKCKFMVNESEVVEPNDCESL